MRLKILVFFLLSTFACNLTDRVEQASSKDEKLKFSNRTIRSLQAELKSDTRNAIRQMTVNEAVEEADRLYEGEAYDKAYYYYDYANSKKPFNKEISYRLGVASLAVRDYTKAQENLKFYIGKPDYPLARYHYGRALMHLSEYERAIQQFDRYLLEYKEADSTLYHLAVRYRDGATFAANPRVSNLRIDRLFANVNSGYTETGATTTPTGTIVYTHFDKNAKSIIKQVDPNGIDEPVELASNINIEDFINKDPFITQDGQTMYFTRCYYGELPECAIYIADLKGGGKIENVRKLNEIINLAGFSSMHPAVAANEYGQEILYFSSDRPGGYGGMDIWFSIRLTNGEYTRPYNCGSRVNSDFDEVTPYYNELQQLLYFSANHPETMGGFDVYKTKGEKRYWSRVINMGIPVNSSADDYYYRMPRAEGHFVSNREGAPFADYSNCCDDIYVVKAPRKKLVEQ